jgi:catechol 2,3-dioxygenase-like lactoylglutathione lyase family enzyme
MLGEIDATACVAVKDMGTAKQFYEEMLGLKSETVSDPGGVTYKSGGSKVFVYVSEYAGTNKATAVSWTVGDKLEELVEELKGKGVSFEHYDNIPEVTREGDIHTAGGLKSAWFKDPDGNILNLVSGM